MWIANDLQIKSKSNLKNNRFRFDLMKKKKLFDLILIWLQLYEKNKSNHQIFFIIIQADQPLNFLIISR